MRRSGSNANDELQQKRAKMAEYQRKRRQNETPEERANRAERQRMSRAKSALNNGGVSTNTQNMRNRRSNNQDEVRVRDAERMRRIRANASQEQRRAEIVSSQNYQALRSNRQSMQLFEIAKGY